MISIGDTLLHYKRPEIQKEIVESAKDREIDTEKVDIKDEKLRGKEWPKVGRMIEYKTDSGVWKLYKVIHHKGSSITIALRGIHNNNIIKVIFYKNSESGKQKIKERFVKHRYNINRAPLKQQRKPKRKQTIFITNIIP